jgi:tRNA pseudouridine38-40 synthase
METYLCRVGYLGWNFKGTNIQPKERTVEGELERILGGKVRFLSRTDAGVSAMNNYALCKIETNPFSVNQLEDIWVTGYVPVERRPKVFWRWYRYYLPEELPIDEEILKLFEGRKDFSSFSIPEGKDPRREVLRFRAFQLKDFTIFDVIGKSFLRQMVRRIVMGYVLALRGEIDIEELFQKPQPKKVPPAPPEGLILMDMKLDTYVPAKEEVVEMVRRRLEDRWKELRLRAFLLSNRWIL